MKVRLISYLTLISSFFVSAYGENATWNLNPISGDWNTDTNWTPQTVPNGRIDTATFGPSSITAISLSAEVLLKAITFSSDADPYSVTIPEATQLRVGALTNDSTNEQNIVVSPTGRLLVKGTARVDPNVTITNQGSTTFQHGSLSYFLERASAGDGTIVNESGDSPYFVATIFSDHSTAERATIINEAGPRGTINGVTIFRRKSTAAASLITNKAASGANGLNLAGGECLFYEQASAGNSTITCEGGAETDAGGGSTQFYGYSSAGVATLIANGGTNGGTGGGFKFLEPSTAVHAHLKIFGNGYLDVSQYYSQCPIGSLAGDGLVYLGSSTLMIGNDEDDSIFYGVIQERGGGGTGSGGGVLKVGASTCTLSGASTYTGNTVIQDGILLLNNTSGSATGTGVVEVNAGTLGGIGIVSDAVAVGTGGGTGASISPGAKGTLTTGTFTAQQSVNWNQDASYECEIDSDNSTADQVSAKGITISGANIVLTDLGNTILPTGTTFTILTNTATTAIAGTFVNLPDGGTITVGSNTYLANYEGGNGNDLILTVL